MGPYNCLFALLSVGVQPIAPRCGPDFCRQARAQDLERELARVRGSVDSVTLESRQIRWESEAEQARVSQLQQRLDEVEVRTSLLCLPTFDSSIHVCF